LKILLINPPIRTWAPPNCFPQGLGYIAQMLRKDHDVEVLDLNAERLSWTGVICRLLRIEYNTVGITGLITNYEYVKWLIEEIHTVKPSICLIDREGKKHYANTPIVVGGVLGSSIPEIMLRKAEADICVIGEGELTAVELFNKMEELSDWRDIKKAGIKGIAYLRDGEFIREEARESISDISQLPLPAYDLFPIETYLGNPVGSTINKNKWIDGKAEKVPLSMNILSSRGCAWQCFFCYHDYMGVRYRYRNPQSLFDEIVFLYERYGVKFILMGDDTFITNRKNVMEFCDLMIFSGMNKIIRWECGARVNTVDRELLEECKEAGCSLVGYGIESGSQKMLDVLNKKVTVEQCHKAVEMTQEIFGDCEVTFIIGSPGETRETIQETVDFCKRHNLPPHAVFFLTPYPGTPLWQWMREEGWFGSSRIRLDEEERMCLRLSDNEQGENILVNFTDFTDEELMEIKQAMVKELNAWNKLEH